MELFSIKMRASKNEQGQSLHISGAEKIVPKERLFACCNQLMTRALQHAKGDPDAINIKVERIDETKLTYLQALPVTTREVANAAEGRAELRRLLLQEGIARADEIVALLQETYAMRGAMLLDVDTLTRLEPDRARGVRATYMDVTGNEDSRSEKNHFKEALVLATKVSHHPNIVGELCISDDPDYVTGYFASKAQGYVRITKLKEMGSPEGGRIFLFRGSREEAEACIHYLEHEAVLVTLPE